MSRELLAMALDALEGTDLALRYAAITALREALAATSASPAVPLTDEQIDSVIRDVAELDYSSPEGMPDVMLVTADELRAELLKSLADNAALRERVKLLEMAAKAAGIVLGEHARFIGGDHPQLWFYNDSRKHPMCRKPNRAGNVPWNPLADDGDALRLAVKLDIDLIRESLDDVPSTPTHVKAQSWDLEFSASEALGDDHYAATRRAIVRAAAEIGRAMP